MRHGSTDAAPLQHSTPDSTDADTFEYHIQSEYPCRNDTSKEIFQISQSHFSQTDFWWSLQLLWCFKEKKIPLISFKRCFALQKTLRLWFRSHRCLLYIHIYIILYIYVCVCYILWFRLCLVHYTVFLQSEHFKSRKKEERKKRKKERKKKERKKEERKERKKKKERKRKKERKKERKKSYLWLNHSFSISGWILIPQNKQKGIRFCFKKNHYMAVTILYF